MLASSSLGKWYWEMVRENGAGKWCGKMALGLSNVGVSEGAYRIKPREE
jgi:hypothetical protein